MSTVLVEKTVLEEGRAKACIARTTRRFFPWDVFLVVTCDPEDPREKWGSKDPTFGYSGFIPVRALQRYYVDDITFYGKQCGRRIFEGSAETHATEQLRKYIKWRDKQVAIIEEANA